MIQVGPTELDERKLSELCRRYGVRFLPETDPGLLDHAGLMLDLGALLGRKVDLVSKKALNPLIREAIIQDSRRLYAA